MSRESFTTAILLAGGTGTRMQSTIAKQYLELDGKPLILHPFEVLQSSPHINSIVVVCREEYQHLFTTAEDKELRFAVPGARRQDSVNNGVAAAASATRLFVVHDGARPLLTCDMIERVVTAGLYHGAAAIGQRVPYTVKQTDREGQVVATLDRDCLWEVQTPQVVKAALMAEGLSRVAADEITVTDDLGMVEHLGEAAIMVEAQAPNIKVTVPGDLEIAEKLLCRIRTAACEVDR